MTTASGLLFLATSWSLLEIGGRAKVESHWCMIGRPGAEGQFLLIKKGPTQTVFVHLERQIRVSQILGISVG